ncbi:MAG: CofH family radical SAM protein [Bacteroides sp.]
MQTTKISSNTETDRVIQHALTQKRTLIEKYFDKSSMAVQTAMELLLSGERLTYNAGLALFYEAELPLLALAATYVRLQKHGLVTYYNRNGHIEPTNICLFQCRFCSYRRNEGEKGAWRLSRKTIVERLEAQCAQGNTEVHITGGVDPRWHIEDLEALIELVHSTAPTLHIKAFSAVELLAIFSRSGVGMREGLLRLKMAGLNSIPGGGAEIFDPTVRRQICPEKCTGAEWLALHRTAHEIGLFTNATMLFGHIEHYEHRLEHILALRELQDATQGFNCFIPLKFRAAHNPMAQAGEISLLEVLRTYAISRLLLDNIPHLKCYWPMLGKANLALALHYGVDDLDGTIGNSTQIYSMAGAQDASPSATVEELEILVQNEGYKAYERDSLYRILVKNA